MLTCIWIGNGREGTEIMGGIIREDTGNHKRTTSERAECLNVTMM